MFQIFRSFARSLIPVVYRSVENQVDTDPIQGHPGAKSVTDRLEF
jgi:hypothetical protein